MEFTSFSVLFCSATNQNPYQYQVRVATGSRLPDVLNVPTGVGKTATTVLSWLWRRRFADEATRASTPRRLVICLPQRVLVEQTVNQVERWLKNLNLYYKDDVQQTKDLGIPVHALLGGELDTTWEAFPERDAILVGTQDQLLSRALNRGYGSSRYLWPVHFALLHNDCLWAIDEVQLMGAGLCTTTQLQAFRERFLTYGSAQTLWISATVELKWLSTIDFSDRAHQLEVCELTSDERLESAIRTRLEAHKPLQFAAFTMTKDTLKKTSDYTHSVVQTVVMNHRHGTITLVIVNRVARAQAIFAALKNILPNEQQCMLVHSRFRSADRLKLNHKLLELADNGGDCIIVATQAMEAGVDISARTLITELAPWTSMVQRFGRCNRRGEALETVVEGARVIVIDISDDAESCMPYECTAIAEARSMMGGLADVGPIYLETRKLEAKPLDHYMWLRKRDLLDLFDTSPDLTGTDIDISPYIRATREIDVQIYWREFADDKPTDSSLSRHHVGEMCVVSISQIRDYLSKSQKGEKYQRHAWTWDGVEGPALRGQFVEVDKNAVYPGQTLLLNACCGGYENELGFVSDSWQPVLVLPVQENLIKRWDFPNSASAQGSDEESAMPEPITLTRHLLDVSEEAQQIANSFPFDWPSEAVIEATKFHDIGKSHAAFQAILFGDGQSSAWWPNELLAKSPAIRSNHMDKASGNWNEIHSSVDRRPGFRHELASALAYLQLYPPCDELESYRWLVAYLIATHHGKVRVSIRSLPTERIPAHGVLFARGVHDGDRLPVVKLGDGTATQELILDLSPMQLGNYSTLKTADLDGYSTVGSWTEHVLKLVDAYGPFRMAWLETMVRIADWRGSAKEATP